MTNKNNDNWPIQKNLYNCKNYQENRVIEYFLYSYNYDVCRKRK